MKKEDKKIYKDAKAFRAALEDRLNKIASAEKLDLGQVRLQVAFDRLLARLFLQDPSPWILKGGYAMQLRILHARATKDIDLSLRDMKLLSSSVSDQNEAIFESLREKLALDLSDYFIFSVGAATMDLEAAPYGGARFPIEIRMDGRIFSKFSLDIGVGDAVTEPLETITARDWLGFADIPSTPVLAISREQQFAEKLHAYTLPRDGRLNTRVKDLIDMVLLVDSEKLDAKRLTAAIVATFKRRGTHPAPVAFPEAPTQWTIPFEKLAEECGIVRDLQAAHQKVTSYLQRIL